MKDHIRKRTLEEADLVVGTGCTVRECGKEMKVSKSTVFKDLTERLPDINPFLYRAVRDVLDKNKEERAFRGGVATKRKYKGKKRTLAYGSRQEIDNKKINGLNSIY